MTTTATTTVDDLPTRADSYYLRVDPGPWKRDSDSERNRGAGNRDVSRMETSTPALLRDHKEQMQIHSSGEDHGGDQSERCEHQALDRSAGQGQDSKQSHTIRNATVYNLAIDNIGTERHTDTYRNGATPGKSGGNRHRCRLETQELESCRPQEQRDSSRKRRPCRVPCTYNFIVEHSLPLMP